MLYLRALIFTLLVPGFVAGWAPRMLLASGHEVRAFDAGPWRWAGPFYRRKAGRAAPG